MKPATLLSVLLAGPALAKTSACKKKSSSTSTTHTTSVSVPAKQHPGCNADNCARAVTGTFQGSATQASHRSDCSSFFSCTAYPATVTITETATTYPTTATVTVFPVTETDIDTVVTVTVVDPTITEISTVIETIIDQITATEPVSVISETVTAVGQKRAAVVSNAPSASSVVCPSAVPTYASACSGTARFSSACSCFGVTKTTTTVATPTTTVTTTVTGLTTVTASDTSIITELVSVTSSVPTTILLTSTLSDIITSIVTIQPLSTTVVTVQPPATTGNAYCENGQPVNGLSAPCTTVGCSTVNLRIEGASDTIYEGVILNGPRNITTASGGTHLCDGTNNNANPTPFENGISAIDAASMLCTFTYDGTFSTEFDDFFIQRIAGTDQTGDDFWGILLNFEFTPAGGCETEVHPTDELLWAFNAFNVNYFLRVEPTQTPVVLAPGQSTTFTVQGTDGNGDPFVNIAGATFNGETSDGNGNVPFTAPTTPGTYRYKATRSDSIRSNAVTIVVQG